MISVLVVAAEGSGELAGHHPSVEVLTAHGVEDALEKLGRNRRIDAVLLLSGEISEVAAAIEEDNPAHPPLFQPAGGRAMPGVRILPAGDPGHLIDLLIGELEG